MGRHGWFRGAAALTAVVATACQEDLLAPGAGACPAFCPPEQVVVVDSLLLDGVVNDSSFVGYVLPGEAGGAQLVSDAGGPVPTSRAVVRFAPFAERLQLGPGDTTTGPVIAIDSFEVRIPITSRGGAGLELRLYRLPATVESNVTFAALDPYFADSALVATLPLPDSLTNGSDTVRLAADAFPTLDADGRVAALGLELRAVDRGHVVLGTLEGAAAVTLTRHVQVDSAGQPVARAEARLPSFDTFVAPDPPAIPDDPLRVGGAPSRRSLLRFSLPPRILDSSTVVKATLILVPVQPSVGAPGDTVRMLAQGVAADVGAKSPLLAVAEEDLTLLVASVLVGTADTVRLDVTDLVLSWAADSTRPRSVMVRAIPEGNTFGEVIFGSSGGAAARPALQVTFVPPLTLGGR
jgi:hypothetical protein